ncbi:MAG: hypothetical protein HYW95_00705 [Candidatus Wildermuthbacteria bacterium]|nr:hypothetical protein [Candidatus Wildermuthbacteria bacterium]
MANSEEEAILKATDPRITLGKEEYDGGIVGSWEIPKVRLVGKLIPRKLIETEQKLLQGKIRRDPALEEFLENLKRATELTVPKGKG